MEGVVVGHRALVAYERPGDGYTVRYSHWGARGYRLLESVTASTPLGGGGNDGSDTAGMDGSDTTGDDGSEKRGDDARDEPMVRPSPLGVAADVADVAASFVDPLLHEAVFVVSDSFCTRAFEPLAFWGGAPTTVHGGALLELRRDRAPTADARELRAWRRGAIAMLEADVDAEADDPTQVTPSAAQQRHERLLAGLRSEVEDRDLYPIPPDRSRSEP